ncbi:MAG: cation acetate symporter [Bacteroidales bacterium]|nr:cation acetate symporter [Bacteroidales bacterium]
MIYEVSTLAIVIFLFFVVTVIGLSLYFGNKTKSASSYYAAGGKIHWAVNGIAFAGDYLSAASFLGICGMIAFYGYDGFVYSIGFLAGWMVALFIVAEPMKRMGKYTFADALDSKFNSRAIKLTAAISTLVVSVFYLIPQMVGAGAIMLPLLGFPHWVGVTLVGAIVIIIVATAGMTSTTYVQFIKGGLLIIFSTVIAFYIFQNGLNLKPTKDYHDFITLNAQVAEGNITAVEDDSYTIESQHNFENVVLVKLSKDGIPTWWKLNIKDDKASLEEALAITITADGAHLYNGEVQAAGRFYQVGHFNKIIIDGKEVESTGPVGAMEFLKLVEDSEIVRFSKKIIFDKNEKITVFYQNITLGKDIMKPGLYYKLDKGATAWSKIDFISLMLALFLGTAALPHILIRYYTVPDQRSARRSTILAIAAIGFFYVLTLFIGTGAMVGGGLDVESSNMSAPLLAKTFGIVLFSIVSALAFATILGTVSGLIVASAGAVAHDLMDNYFKIEMSDHAKVKAGKITSVVVGIIAIILGIIFKDQNVSFLVGLAFAIAASANLPAIIMILFWKKTTAKGISWAIVVGMVSSLGLILLSPTMYEIYGLPAKSAPIPLQNPGIITIPLGFLVLYLVSLFTYVKRSKTDKDTVSVIAE